MVVTIVIRTLNEEKHLPDLLTKIAAQKTLNLEIEVILVDSGSTDDTLKIAHSHGCKIVHITHEEFSFGRALNIGCKAAKGDIIVMVSGHCVPKDNSWVQSLCQPLINGESVYTYGRQLGGVDSHYSECQIFAKYYPESSQIPQEGFYCNNANAAIYRVAWARHEFNEDLTGLEDMELAKKLVENGEKIAYVAQAAIYHYHDEEWGGIKRRFERESIALQAIMPQVHIRKLDFIRYLISSVWFDWKRALNEGVFFKAAIEIPQYRFYQYWGSYVGNHDHRKLSHAQKEKYFFPN